MASHSIFDTTPLDSLVTGSDSQTPIRIGTLFYTYGAGTTNWRCRGARLYLTNPSSMPTLITINLWVQPTITAATLGTPPLRSVTVNTATTRGQWTEVTWDSVEVTPGQVFMVSYEAENVYQYIPGTANAPYDSYLQATDGSSLYLAEIFTPARGYYYTTDGSSSGGFHYYSGLDVLVDDDSTTPTIPANLTASVTNQTVALTWDAATDNIGVTGYYIYRSTSLGFTADQTTQIAAIGPVTTYNDIIFSSDTYYYKVAAVDAANNLSDTSNEAVATVVADGTGINLYPSGIGWSVGAQYDDMIAAGLSLGTVFALSDPSPIVGVRFYAPVIMLSGMTVHLWDQVSGIELVGKTGLGAVAGWNTYLFDSQYAGQIGINYIVSVYLPGGVPQSYTAQPQMFSNTRTEMGNVYSETDFNGVYVEGSGCPTNSLNSNWYGIDVIAQAPVRTGKIKVWDGADWQSHPLKVWDGSQWITRPVSGHDGSSFIAGK